MLLNNTSFKAIPFGIILYSENQLRNLIVVFFNGVTSNFFKTLLILKFLLDIAKVGSQHTRQAHIPGWSVEPEIYTQYMKGVIDNMYKHAAQVKMRDDIHTYQQESFKKHNDPDYTQSWTDFFRLYANESLGYPTEIPKKVLDNPNQKISGTPYAWFADSAVKNRINSIRERLGIGKAKDEGLPQELKYLELQLDLVLILWTKLD